MTGRTILLAVAATLAAACYSTGEGPSPPKAELYFPTALAMSSDRSALYAVSSDFDLQYNAGTVQVYDLGALRKQLPRLWEGEGCGDLGPNPSRVLYPGACGPLDVSPLVRASAEIGAFATDALLLDNPEGPGARLFLPVRGDPSLTYFDLPHPFALDCGQGRAGGRCSPEYRLGTNPEDNARGLTIPPEPFGIAAIMAKTPGPSGETWQQAVVVTHQTTGNLSLFTGTGPEGDSLFHGHPRLEYVLSGLPSGATGIAALPYPERLAELSGASEPEHQPGLLVSFRNSAQLQLVRYFSQSYAAPANPFLMAAGRTPISINANGYDSRGIAIGSGEERAACEAGCAVVDEAEQAECVRSCANIPVPVYVANRTPTTLLIGETRTSGLASESGDLVNLYDSVPVAPGASRVVLGHVLDREGNRRERVFVVCFDARVIYVYDPVARRIAGTIPTGRGPNSLVLDIGTMDGEPYAFGYVAHFTDSYIGVVDLNEAHTDTFMTMIATVGHPKPPRETK